MSAEKISVDGECPGTLCYLEENLAKKAEKECPERQEEN